MKKIAVFASGSGSNFQALIDYNQKQRFCEIALLVASKDNIFAIERAKKNNINHAVFSKKDYAGTREMFTALDKTLKDNGIDFIVLAGYLTVLPEFFVNGYENRIINVHPSLVPSFCGDGFYGLKVHSAALDYGVKLSGCTVHFVNSQTDGGAIIFQNSVEVNDGDTPESLQARITEKEHLLLPRATELLCLNRLKIKGRQVTIKEQ